MKHIVIAISREFGSGGGEISQKLAQRLGISFYDKNILPAVAKKRGISVQQLEEMEERLTDPVDAWYSPGVRDSSSESDKIFGIQAKLIREVAAAESCVFVGRCAWDVLLGDDVIRIFVYAPDRFKVARIKEEQRLPSEREAEYIVHARNRNRQRYVEHYSTHKWYGPENYDLMIDSSKLGVDGTVDFLASYVQRRLGMESE